LSLLFTPKFSSARQFKNRIELFSTLLDDYGKICVQKKFTCCRKFFCLFTEKFSRTSTIYPGIFLGRAVWADSVSPRMNTIASHDQFKPIRIGENLVVNYNVI